jgi:pSer/pThr/pTyr-binding forkhead associated (FHA) protein
MSDNNLTKPKKNFSADWLVGGILTKIGDTFDRLTGRNWKPTSSLATSELIDKLKKLLDSEAKDLGEKGLFVPHNIKLKMQWNKFSTDSEEGLKKLEYEMLAAAIDHINDNRYHSYKPLKIEIKPDYFTEGIQFLASFGEFAEEDKDAVVDITVPQMRVADLIPEAINVEPEGEIYIAEFTASDKQKSVELKFIPGKRVGVGRTKENDLSIEDPSISKIHAALVLNTDNQLMVADTGSTNGTFINGQRIAYGRAFPVGESDKLKFGMVEVYLRAVPKETSFETSQSYQTETGATENFQTNQDFQTNQNQKTMPDFETNNDYLTHKKEKPTEVYPSSSGSTDVPVPQGTINDTFSIGETNPVIPMPQPKDTFQGSAIPVSQPKDTFQANEIPVSQPKDTFQGGRDLRVENEPKVENQGLKNIEDNVADENQSQVFSTEPRVKLNFEDDEEK